MSSSPPGTLGKYQIIREIARSNDIVYEAYDPLMHRRVALKELAMPTGATVQQKEERVRRFQREGQAAGSLNHPNIMTVYELGQEGDRFFMALEYLDGHTLRNEIDSKGFLPVDQAVRLVKEVLKGLQFAHDKGVIHRDIKPDNVQLLSDGTVKITDFGIARLTFQPNLTVDGQVFGTPSYMSPEQVVGKDIDPRSDLFSVGVLLYEMLSGRKPFQGTSVMETTAQIMNKAPERLAQLDYSLWRVVEQALDKVPGSRFPSASRMIDALDQAVAAPAPEPPANPFALGGTYPPNGQPSYPNASYPAINPYGPPPAFNPYGSPPPGGQMGGPPVQFPYNPYLNPGAGAVAPHTPGSAPPMPGQLPVYYPPPPRPPLLKPEHRLVLGKIGLAVMILGTIFFLVIVAAQALTDAVNNQNASSRDRMVPRPSASGSVQDRLNQESQYRDRLTSNDAKVLADARLAALLIQQARDLFQTQPPEAESKLKQAMTLDPGNPNAPYALGDLYVQEVRRSDDSRARAELWQEAGHAYGASSGLMAEGRERDRARAMGAEALMNAARQTQVLGDEPSARALLYEARSVAPPNTEIALAIQGLIAELSAN